MLFSRDVPLFLPEYWISCDSTKKLEATWPGGGPEDPTNVVRGP